MMDGVFADFRDKSWQRLTLGPRLGSPGSQGEVYSTLERPELCVKICSSTESPELARRVEAMMRIPTDRMGEKGHFRVSWPVARARDLTTEHVVGTVMPALLPPRYRWFPRMQSIEDRLKVLPEETWCWKLAVAQNLAQRVVERHDANQVLGDIAPGNMFVTSAGEVTLIDPDGWQFVDPETNECFPCPLSRPEYTAPEHPNPNDRSPRQRTSDLFALAIVLFEILLEGSHPFTGFPVDQPDAHIEEADNIAAGRSWVVDRGAMLLPSSTLPLDLLPATLLDGFKQCFAVGLRQPDRRPAAEWWAESLAAAQYDLRVCKRNPFHEFGRDAAECPWHRQIDQGLPDNYPDPRERRAPAKAPSPTADVDDDRPSRSMPGFSPKPPQRPAPKTTTGPRSMPGQPSPPTHPPKAPGASPRPQQPASPKPKSQPTARPRIFSTPATSGPRKPSDYDLSWLVALLVVIGIVLLVKLLA